MSKEIKALVSEILNPKLDISEQKIITASKIQLPEHSNGHLSPSQITMYLRCGYQYWKRYGEGKKCPPGVAMVEGTSHHETIHDNNKYKIKHGKDRPTKHLQADFADRFSDNQKEIPKKEWNLSGETKDSVIKRGQILQKKHHDTFAPTFQPELAEQELRFKVGEVEVLGYLDAAGTITSMKKKKDAVVDYKAVSRKKSDDELKGSIQLSFYGWGALDLIENLNLTKNPPYVGFLSLVKTKDPYVLWQPILLEVERIKWFRKVVTSVANSISLGSFPMCDPTSWCCNSRFCGYFNQCRGKK